MRRVSPSTITRRIAAPQSVLRARIPPAALAGSSAGSSRTIFSWFKRKPAPSPFTPPPAPPPILAQNDLFHPLSKSPFPALQEKAARIKETSLCPISFERYGERLRPEFECPDCGFPTHATRERWEQGLHEHQEYCERLREVNEDEHDIRSGREMKEFENMPAQQAYEAAVSFSSWDNFFFTRDFPSIDTDRSVRHVSKVLTYPITVAGVLHQNGPYTSGNGRITSEGRRSMAALHSMLHVPPGASDETVPIKPQAPIRIFLLGARAESTLPPHLWQQLTWLFPRNNFNIYFIGPEVGLPIFSKTSPRRKTRYEFTEDGGWGAPSYHVAISPQLSLTSIKAPYQDIHAQLGPFDPYTDVFFAFSPGLGFPHQNQLNPLPPDEEMIEGELVQAQTTWKKPIQQILKTKCALFFTAFSPLDLQRDVSALFGTPPPSVTGAGPREFPDFVKLPTRPVPTIEGVSDEFDLILTPGANLFESRKWEIAEWDVRVGVRTNWGVWGIRGKKYAVVEGEE